MKKDLTFSLNPYNIITMINNKHIGGHMTKEMELGKVSINELREMLNSRKINNCCFKAAVKKREAFMMSLPIPQYI